jgi:hypothetical protein
LKAWKADFRERVQASGVSRTALVELVFGTNAEFGSQDSDHSDCVPCSFDHGHSLFNAATVEEAETISGAALRSLQSKN